MEEQSQNSVSLEIPSRWRRFFAYMLDILINLAVILISTFTGILGFILILVWLIINLVIVFGKKTTLGSKIMGIKSTNENNDPINTKQAFFRYLIFSPILLNIIICVWILVSLIFQSIPELCSQGNPSDSCQIRYTVSKITNIICIILLMPCFINIFEIFFKCPTFIDKRLGIKRLYKKSK